MRDFCKEFAPMHEGIAGKHGKNPGQEHAATSALSLDPRIEQEVQRIRKVFEQRAQAPVSEWIPHFNLYARYLAYERTGILLDTFRKLNVKTLAGLKILDVGCGSGTLLRYLFDFGAEPENLFGVDVIEDTLKRARYLMPNVSFTVASAARLPFPDASFDLAFQSLVFTSVLDGKIKTAMASEVLRVLKKGGRFVWYDFLYDNPWNKNVKGIGKKEIYKLLPGCNFKFRKLTLAPPLGRPTAALSPFLYHLLSQIPWLCTHYLCIAQKQE
jgi:ubiquinone/menaquinone biosynthesis C-methylase UbiE